MDTTTERTETQRVFDTYVQDGGLRDLEAHDRDALLGAWNPVRVQTNALLQERHEIERSRDNSEAGRAKQLAKWADRAKAAVDGWKLEAALACVVAEQDALEARAIQGVVQTATGWADAPAFEMTPVATARIREIRDRLVGLKPGEADMLYLTAVRDGSDPELVHAIETAPKAFPVIRPSTAIGARRLKLESSPLWPRLEKVAALRSAYEHFWFKARTELGVRE